MSLHTWRRQGPREPSSCSTFTHSHWGRAAAGKKRLAPTHAGSLQSCPILCDTVDCGLPDFSVRGFSRQEHWSGLASTGCHTFWSTVYPAAPAANPPEDLVRPEPLRPKQLPHLPTRPSQGRTQVPQGSLRSKPQWATHMQRWR